MNLLISLLNNFKFDPLYIKMLGIKANSLVLATGYYSSSVYLEKIIHLLDFILPFIFDNCQYKISDIAKGSLFI